MRKSILIVSALSIAVSAPVHALGLGDLAKVVLGGNSVLKKGETKCGASLGLTNQDSLTMKIAESAAKKVLSPVEYLALNTASEQQAASASQSKTFCTETKAKKPGLLKSIAKAGKKLATAGVLGGI